ncbi:MAG: hypothetical protein HQM11_06820 [SAR324 cluster bacterium]|nr:hypothetical protein [SAR324 cluster bacterium]
MIRRSAGQSNADISYSNNLKNTLQSLFRFQDDIPPPPPEFVEVSSITYINYKKILEMSRNTIAVIKSEVVAVDVSEVKDVLFILQLAIYRTSYKLNILDTRLEQLETFISSQANWKIHWPWTKSYDAHVKSKNLKTEYEKGKQLLDKLKFQHQELQRSIRQMALAMIKHDLPPEEHERLLAVELLEDTRTHIFYILESIDEHIHQAQQLKKIVYYESDRIQIYNALSKINLLMNTLDNHVRILNWNPALFNNEFVTTLKTGVKRGILWYLFDRYVFRLFTLREPPLRLLMERLDHLLQPESYRLNRYAEQVAGLHSLIGHYQFENNFTEGKTTSSDSIVNDEGFTDVFDSNPQQENVILEKDQLPQDSTLELSLDMEEFSKLNNDSTKL